MVVKSFDLVCSYYLSWAALLTRTPHNTRVIYSSCGRYEGVLMIVIVPITWRGCLFDSAGVDDVLDSVSHVFLSRVGICCPAIVVWRYSTDRLTFGRSGI